jgi:hypothetical protein
VAAGVWLTVPRRPAIMAEQFGQVKEGMTQVEVEAVPGLPPGDYRNGAVVIFLEYDDIAKRDGRIETWAAEAGGVRVTFDQKGKAAIVERADVIHFRRHSWWARLKAVFGL